MKRDGARTQIAARGFTLTELLMVSGLGLVLMTIILGATNISSQVLVALHGQGVVQMQLNTAMSLLSQDGRIATTATSTATSLTLTVPSIDVNGAPLIGMSDTFTYDFNAATGILQRTVNPGGGVRENLVQVVAHGITQVTFDTSSPRAVTITLSARQMESGYAFDGVLSTQVAFRNI